jgi:hypothetical protein
MPRMSIKLSLYEVQVAVADYVAGACETQVSAGSLEFEYDAEGFVVGASFDVVRDPPEAGQRPAQVLAPVPTSKPLFALTSKKEDGGVVEGDREKVLRRFHPAAVEARATAEAWMKDAKVGQAVELVTKRGLPMYELTRVS